MKGIGTLLLILTGVGWGCAARHTLCRRLTLMQQTEHLLRYLAEQIRYTAAPVSELLRACAARADLTTFALLTDTVAALGADGEFRSAWQEAVETQQQAVSLTAEECTLLTEAVCLLGTADVAGECRHCEQYAERLRTHIHARTEELRVRGRLYTALGLCGGCAAALLLW